MLGGSYYSGNAGQSQEIDVGGTEFKLPNARTSIWELHSTWAWRNLTTRALWTQARVGDAAELSQLFSDAGNEQPVISSRMIGGYVEAAYDVMPLFRSGSEMSLEPFFRFEYVDTQNDVPLGLRRRSPVQAAHLHPRHPVQADPERGVEARLPKRR